jgi:hypothetical protein
MFNSNQTFLLVQKLELEPMGFTLGGKVEIGKKLLSICPQVINKC